MEVKNRLTSLGTIVDHQPVAIGDSHLLRHTPGDEEQPTQQALVSWLHTAHTRDVAVRHDKDVDGSLAVQVVERRHLFVLVDNTRRSLTGDDATKEAIPHHATSPTRTDSRADTNRVGTKLLDRSPVERVTTRM